MDEPAIQPLVIGVVVDENGVPFLALFTPEGRMLAGQVDATFESGKGDKAAGLTVTFNVGPDTGVQMLSSATPPDWAVPGQGEPEPAASASTFVAKATARFTGPEAVPNPDPKFAFAPPGTPVADVHPTYVRPAPPAPARSPLDEPYSHPDAFAAAARVKLWSV